MIMGAKPLSYERRVIGAVADASQAGNSAPLAFKQMAGAHSSVVSQPFPAHS